MLDKDFLRNQHIQLFLKYLFEVLTGERNSLWGDLKDRFLCRSSLCSNSVASRIVFRVLEKCQVELRPPAPLLRRKSPHLGLHLKLKVLH